MPANVPIAIWSMDSKVALQPPPPSHPIKCPSMQCHLQLEVVELPSCRRCKSLTAVTYADETAIASLPQLKTKISRHSSTRCYARPSRSDPIVC